MKIYITRHSAGSIISGGLERLDVWFHKPSYYYKDYEPYEQAFGVPNYSNGARIVGWRVDDGGSIERRCFSFGNVFGYIEDDNENVELSTYVWNKLQEHFLHAPFRQWEELEKENKVFLKDFLLEVEININLKKDI